MPLFIQYEYSATARVTLFPLLSLHQDVARRIVFQLTIRDENKAEK